MKIGERIILKNLGECVVLSEYNGRIFVSMNGVGWFVDNPTKKRQKEEYSYDNIVCYGFTFDDAFNIIDPMYIDMLDSLMKQYKIDKTSARMLIDAVCREV